MMAAAGCGSATAAAVVGAGGVGAARGRFPGRPWSSRSRLRSEKRWQLGRTRTDHDEISSSGGPRPTCLVFALNEDQSHLRLLGIEASYKSLGEAGYSSSGSEEVGACVKLWSLYTTRSWPCFAWPCWIGRNSNVSLVRLQSSCVQQNGHASNSAPARVNCVSGMFKGVHGRHCGRSGGFKIAVVFIHTSSVYTQYFRVCIKALHYNAEGEGVITVAL